jgi:hypothetical protein
MSADTAPLPEGIRSNVYVVPLPAKLPTVAFPAVMSPAVKPLTLSLKVTVIAMAALVGSLALELSTTAGLVLSMVNVSPEVKFPLPVPLPPNLLPALSVMYSGSTCQDTFFGSYPLTL